MSPFLGSNSTEVAAAPPTEIHSITFAVLRFLPQWRQGDGCRGMITNRHDDVEGSNKSWFFLNKPSISGWGIFRSLLGDALFQFKLFRGRKSYCAILNDCLKDGIILGGISAHVERRRKDSSNYDYPLRLALEDVLGVELEGGAANYNLIIIPGGSFSCSLSLLHFRAEEVSVTCFAVLSSV